ncbi:hypothetical protein [Nocardia sp. NPDC020380]|uniref:hypothetical protein n=1 Tax=Nocardia sp. NPDC020380 TaxID=3364309 RepID=UPI0037A785FC
MAEENTRRLSVRFNQLFATFHRRGTPEQTSAEIANGVGATLARAVAPEEVEKIRRGERDSDWTDLTDVLEAVAQHFGVPAVYLTGTGEAVESIDVTLRLIMAARDGEVEGISLRGDEFDPNDLAGILLKLGSPLDLS